ncbi:response regulator [Azospirillum soli]|uniref:response regulator n=1 Tax=Azospirillum soli TaxID=1304799 RepID=UPI001AE97015|nr:response regulator [Azospirillum soli]MBP2311968.1 CheY-like chemotaxis protein [Azospirillum soli]
MPRRYPSQLKILLVDDNPLLLRALKDMLNLWGVGQVIAAADGQEAKELLRREPYDLLVTDWVMEPVGGAQLLNWVRESPGSLNPDLPIIVLTANADLATVRAAWDAGADSVLAKPAPAATIARRIETVLANPRRNRTKTAGPEPRRPEHPSADRPAAAANPALPNATPPNATPTGAPLRLPPPGVPVRSADPKRVRLLLALDRLEAALDKPDAIGSRLRHAVSDLQIASHGNHGAAAIVGSLSTCVTWVEPDAEGFGEAVQAHVAALRWIASCDEGGADTLIAVRALIRSLRATVRSLTLRGAADADIWPEPAPTPQQGAWGSDGTPLPPA